MQLDRKIETLLSRRSHEGRQRIVCRRLFRHSLHAGQHHVIVQIGVKTLHKSRGPRQPDQGDMRIWCRHPQSAQCRHHAQQVAQLQRPQYRNPTWRGAAPHTGFSSRKLPIASASSGVVQNDSSASRGVHTIGSPRVLKDVLIRTGTPVR